MNQRRSGAKGHFEVGCPAAKYCGFFSKADAALLRYLVLSGQVVKMCCSACFPASMFLSNRNNFFFPAGMP